MEMKLKELYTLVESPFVLDPSMTYPTIEGDTSNFLTDYNTNKADFDTYFLKQHGEKIVDVEGEDDEDYVLNWKAEIKAIQRVYLEAWAHDYFTLNIAYNPVYNVTEDTETTYGQHETTNAFAKTKVTDTYGGTSETFGTHTDTQTQYSVSFDSTTEKETGKVSDSIGSQTNTSLQHTDTHEGDAKTDTTTSKQHIDSVHREGNIGIKSASALAEEEILLREKYIFFKKVFLTIIREVGARYESTFI